MSKPDTDIHGKIQKLFSKPKQEDTALPTTESKNCCPHCGKEIIESADSKIDRILQERSQTKVLEELISRIVKENAELLGKLLAEIPAMLQPQTQPVTESQDPKKEKKIIVNRDDKGEISSLTVRYVDKIDEDETPKKEELYTTPEEIERLKSLL